MQCSFSFCGKDVESIGLKYAPDNSNTYIYSPAESNIHEQSFDGHDGGYYFGETRQPKVFTLRCYYEDKNVLDGIMSKIASMFKIGKSGKLVFTVRPWLYYIATVVNVDTSKLINRDNGFVTINLKAYYPYSRTDETHIDMSSEYADDMRRNSGMFESDLNPATSISTAITEQVPNMLLYNPGTERAAVKVDIAGNTGTGVTIYNRTTEQEMCFRGLNEGSSTSYVECDGLTGNCYFVSNDPTKDGKNAFVYHSYGFIELEPGFPIHRDIMISTTATNTTINVLYGDVSEDWIGLYVYADGDFRKIVNVSTENSTITVNSNCTNSGTETTVVTKMNEIVITPDTTMNLSYLAFNYSPTFA